jgi:hypothetical protein
MWSKLTSISSKQSSQRGIASSIAAGMVCLEVGVFTKNLARGVSLKNNTLTVEVDVQDRLRFALIEEALLLHLITFASEKGLPKPSRIRLTNQ